MTRAALISAFLCASLFAFCHEGHAQEIHFRDSIRKYNNIRIRIDYLHAVTTGAAGVANLAVGLAGALPRSGAEACSYQVAAGFGVAELGLSLLRTAAIPAQFGHRDSYRSTAEYYRRDRNFYIGSVVSDLAVTGIGLALLQNSQAGSADVLRNSGAVRTICTEALGKLVFDQIFWLVHFHNNSRWYDIVTDIQFSGTSLSLRYPLDRGRGRGRGGSGGDF
jgi:hypothetical protein